MNEFLCEYNGADLCFFGGTCMVAISPSDPPERCRCLPGYSADLTVFHDPNCALPDNVLFAFFVEYSILALGFMLVILKSGNGRKFKRLVRFMILTMVTSSAFSLSVYLEGGLFQVSLVLVVALIWGFLRTTVEMTELFFQSASSIVESRTLIKRYRRMMGFAALLFEFALIALAITLIVVARTPRYNLAYIVGMFIVSGFNVILIGLVLSEIERLRIFAKREISRMPSGNDVLAEKWTDLINRIRVLKFAMITYSGVFVLGLVALPIVHLILGSAPFGWVFLYASLHIVLLSCCSIFFFVKQPQDARHSFFAVGENLDSEEVTQYRSMFGGRSPMINARLHFSFGKLMSSKGANTNMASHALTNVDTAVSSNRRQTSNDNNSED